MHTNEEDIDRLPCEPLGRVLFDEMQSTSSVSIERDVSHVSSLVLLFALLVQQVWHVVVIWLLILETTHSIHTVCYDRELLPLTQQLSLLKLLTSRCSNILLKILVTAYFSCSFSSIAN